MPRCPRTPPPPPKERMISEGLRVVRATWIGDIKHPVLKYCHKVYANNRYSHETHLRFALKEQILIDIYMEGGGNESEVTIEIYDDLNFKEDKRAPRILRRSEKMSFNGLPIDALIEKAIEKAF